MPGLCRPINEGGLGFDYRLNMSIPDLWIKLLKEQKDEDWDMMNISHTLTNRRWNEKHISYCESHDQAIVGDKTISMWLFDAEIYTSMAKNQQPSITVDRGMALHKMIRLITIGLGGEGYLNFIGNEFGHPEWVDFPRDGNNHSYHYCRRQWSLADNESLRYSELQRFDNAMIKLEKDYDWLSSSHQYITLNHNSDKMIVFEKGNLLFIFNFHYSNSYTDYKIGTQYNQPHKVVLTTDDIEFGGKGRVDKSVIYKVNKEEHGFSNRANSIMLYVPSRTAIVLKSDW